MQYHAAAPALSPYLAWSRNTPPPRPAAAPSLVQDHVAALALRLYLDLTVDFAPAIPPPLYLAWCNTISSDLAWCRTAPPPPSRPTAAPDLYRIAPNPAVCTWPYFAWFMAERSDGGGRPPAVPSLVHGHNKVWAEQFPLLYLAWCRATTK